MRQLAWIALTVLIGSLAGSASAITFTSLAVLGDSLSDTGNLCPQPDCPSPPYLSGRYSDGPVWIEDVAATLGLPLAPRGFGAIPAGNNYATGGAQTVHVLNLQAPAVGADSGYVLDPTGLFVVWAGANDLPAGGSAANAAANLAQVIQQGIAGGARHFLVPTMFDLSLTPVFSGVTAAQQFVLDLNAALDVQLAGIAGATFYRPDVFGLFNSIVADPGSFGFTNVSTECYTDPPPITCAQPSNHLWWDFRGHPTAAAHSLIAAAALASVPEPSMLSLLAAGLVLIAGARSCNRRARS